MKKESLWKHLPYFLIGSLFLVSTTHADLSSLEDRTSDCAKIYENSEDRTEQEIKAMMTECLENAALEEEKNGGDDTFMVVSMNLQGNKPEGVEATDYESYDVALNADFDLVVPIVPSKLYFQGGMDVLVYVAKPDESSHLRTTLTLNSGVIYRFSIGERTIGVNAFYDTLLEDNFPHHRASIGLDYSYSVVNLGLNYYHPISGWSDADQSASMRRESVLGGLDLHLNVAVTKMLSVYGHGSLFFLDREFEIVDEAQASFGLGVSFHIACGQKMSVGFDLNKNDVDLAALDFENLGVTARVGYSVALDKCEADSGNRSVRREKALRLLEE